MKSAVRKKAILFWENGVLKVSGAAEVADK